MRQVRAEQLIEQVEHMSPDSGTSVLASTNFIRANHLNLTSLRNQCYHITRQTFKCHDKEPDITDRLSKPIAV